MDLPPPREARTNRLAVFLPDDVAEFIQAEAQRRGRRPGEVASHLLSNLVRSAKTDEASAIGGAR